jgi:hypothetical protein
MRESQIQRAIKKSLLFLLAALFILEAWLWEVTGACIRRAIGWVPYQRLKTYIAEHIVHCSPWLTLGIFIIPALLLLPLKFATLFLLAKGYVLPGIGMALFAKLIGLGVSSFLFTLCKPKLMELRFIRWLYGQCLYWRERAQRLVAPYMTRVREAVVRLRALWPRSKWLEKLRLRVHSLRKQYRKHNE